jgi:hypothetical protein
MEITRQLTASKLADYLDGRISLAELVSWAEDAMLEGTTPPDDAEVVSEIIARLGLSDVQAFGLTWEDCQQIFHRLGLSAKIDLVAV